MQGKPSTLRTYVFSLSSQIPNDGIFRCDDAFFEVSFCTLINRKQLDYKPWEFVFPKPYSFERFVSHLFLCTSTAVAIPDKVREHYCGQRCSDSILVAQCRQNTTASCCGAFSCYNSSSFSCILEPRLFPQ